MRFLKRWVLLPTLALGCLTVSAQTEAQKAVLDRIVKNMVFVEGGTFDMGATQEQGNDGFERETPVHKVTLSDYYIGKYEVTQEEWQALMKNNPSRFKGSRNPVEQVSWNDAQEFIEKLNQLTGKHFRLPTEAEWEYAARGGKLSKGYKFAGSDKARQVGWIRITAANPTHPVGLKTPNELGLYDMSGNVWEWCYDGYATYDPDDQVNPRGNELSSSKVYRGGSWNYYERSCRVSSRNDSMPHLKYSFIGIRLVMDAE